jgi:AcrR family transcriptional regulator
MPMSRSKDPRRQAALLAAGRQVLSVKGLDRMTVDDVTSEAGVAKGTFYLYFRSKADLVVALRQEFANRLIATLKDTAVRDAPIDWPDAAHRIVEAAVDGYLSAAPGYRAVLGQRASDPEDEGWTDEIIGLFADFLARGADDEAFAVEDPETAAALLFFALDGTCHRALATGTPDRARLVAAADAVLAGIIRS